ncbi:TPA: hypothetical protein R5E53_005105 [Enterobacter cloacae]|nr:hypothetical protein [Enterobacter cloacae]
MREKVEENELMSTITRERAELKSFITGFLSDPAHDNQSSRSMTAEVFRIALASLEAEADAVCQHQWKFGGANKLQRQKQCVKCGRVELAAQPAPVSVPDAIHSQGEKSASNDYYALGWNACRAAMLHGAEPVKSGLTLREGLAAIRNSGIAIDAGKIQAERDALNSPVIPDGWVMVPVEPTTDMREAYHQAQEEYEETDGLWSPDHQWKAMLAAAPQQEVK